MKRPNVAWRGFCRLGSWLLLCLGVYYLWSRVYRMLPWQAFAKHKPVPLCVSTVELIGLLGSLEWERDGVLEFWDAIGRPDVALARGKGDCDEYAAVALAAGRFGVLDTRSAVWKPYCLMTVTWWTDSGRITGHNVAVFARGPLMRPQFSHVSNWGWRSGDMDTINEVARNIAGRRGAQPMAWSCVTPNLRRVIRYEWIGGGRLS